MMGGGLHQTDKLCVGLCSRRANEIQQYGDFDCDLLFKYANTVLRLGADCV